MAAAMEKEQTFTERLRVCYSQLCKSRVVNKRETDDEALEFFQSFCNISIPRNDAERELNMTIRSLYYGDKTSFIKCAEKAPHLILLTEARSIVLHFGIYNLIYLNWDKNTSQYKAVKNEASLDKFHKKGKNSPTYKRKGGPTYAELLDRIERLEKSEKETSKEKKNELEQIEPDLESPKEKKSWSEV